MADPKSVQITICMGSSCFSRGNNRNIEVVKNFLANASPPINADLRGHLCEGLCKTGPHILVDGKLYNELDPVAVLGLLNHHLARKEEAAS